MERETCNWICLAKLQIDVGANVLRNLLRQSISTSCLSEYKTFWLKTSAKQQRKFNFCARLRAHIFQQFCNLDPATKKDLKPLIKSLESKCNQTFASQVHDLKTWIHNIRQNLGSYGSDIQKVLKSWEMDIQAEIENLCSLLEVFTDWNKSFLSLWSRCQKYLISTIQAHCNNFVSNSISRLATMRITSKDELQTFAKTFEKDTQCIMEMCQSTSMTEPSIQNIEALVNSWRLPEMTNRYDHILKDFVSEVKDNLPELKEICKSDPSLNSWYINLKQIQASWQRQIDDTLDSPTNINKLAQTWHLQLSECPTFNHEQLKIFFHSETIIQTLITMWENKILTDDQICKLTSPISVPDLRALDITCLLILLRTNGLLQPPEFGWEEGITDTDLSVGADLLRLEFYMNDVIRNIQNPLVPYERFQQVEDVLIRLASHGGNDFQNKIKSEIDKIKTCNVEELLEGQFRIDVVNSCMRAILSDVSGLSFSGRPIKIADTKLSYLVILCSLLFGKWRESTLSKEIDSADIGNWTSMVDASTKDFKQYVWQFTAGLLEYANVSDMDQMVAATTARYSDLDNRISSKLMWTEYITKHEAKRKGEESGVGTIRKRRKKSVDRPSTSGLRFSYSHHNIPVQSSYAQIGKFGEKNLVKESIAESALELTTAGFVPEEGNKILEMLRKDDYKSIEAVLREHQIPTKVTIITAVKECEYKESVKFLLSGISDLLKEAIPNSTTVWCGYKLEDPDCPVFVVTLKDRNCSYEIPKPFSEYEIIVRRKHFPNNEERCILKMRGRKRVRVADTANILKCIAANTDKLMMEHSNLSIITASPVKASGYREKQKPELTEKTCIVFFVPVKGIIPIGEKAFPVAINDYSTDVREGEFVLYGSHNAGEYHRRLRMGCSVSRPETNLSGTLGGFVDLPGNKIGCLTAAHVVLTDDQIVMYKKMDEQMRMSWNSSLQNGDITYYVYQPQKTEDSFPFGKVHTIALQEGDTYSSSSVDAAIIEINDYNRNPKSGCFPDGDFYDAGFKNDSPLMYTTGKILDGIPSSRNDFGVIKFGAATGITRGFLDWEGAAARLVSEHGTYCFPTMHRQMQIISSDLFSQNTGDQMEMTPTGFANHGDSGALAFQGSDEDVNDLHAIGMVIGENSTNCLTFVTPISAIFQALSLPNKRFKVFPNVQRSLEEHSVILKSLTENIKAISDNIKTMSENIKTLEQKIDRMTPSVSK